MDDCLWRYTGGFGGCHYDVGHFDSRYKLSVSIDLFDSRRSGIAVLWNGAYLDVVCSRSAPQFATLIRQESGNCTPVSGILSNGKSEVG